MCVCVLYAGFVCVTVICVSFSIHLFSILSLLKTLNPNNDNLNNNETTTGNIHLSFHSFILFLANNVINSFFLFFFLSLVIYFPYSVYCCCFCPRRKIFKSKQNTLIICTWYHHNNKINFFFLVGTTNVNDEKKILNDTHASVKIAKKHYNNNEDNPFVSLCLHCSILFIHTVHILFK